MKSWRALILGDGTNQVRKNIIWNMIGSLLFALASILLFAVAARATGEYYGGIFSIAFTTGQMLLTIGYYEVRPFQVTDVAGEYSFSEYLSARVITCIAMVIAGILYILISGATGVRAAVIFLMCFYKLVDGAADVFEGEFHRKGRLDLSGKSMAFRTLFSGGVFVIVVIVTKNIVAASAAAVIAAVLGFVVFDLFVIGSFEPLRLSTSKKRVLRLLRDCFFLFLGSFLYLYICNAAKYAVDACMSEEAVTYYTDLYLPTSTINLLSGFIFKPLLTTMGESCEHGEWERFRSMVYRLLLGITGLTAVCCLGAFLLGIPVLSLLYQKDISALRIHLILVVLGGGIFAVCQLYYYIFVILRRQKWIMKIYLCITVVAVPTTAVCVHSAGLIGAVLSFVILHAILALCYTARIYAVLRREFCA